MSEQDKKFRDDLPLVFTRNGKECEDQEAALREFKEKALLSAKEQIESALRGEDLVETLRTRNAELKATIERLESENERALQMLELYGVDRKRAKRASNGIDVLATRYRKAERLDRGEIERLRSERQGKVLVDEKPLMDVLYSSSVDAVKLKRIQALLSPEAEQYNATSDKREMTIPEDLAAKHGICPICFGPCRGHESEAEQEGGE